MARCFIFTSRWKRLEDALSMEAKPFPQPWRVINFSDIERSGLSGPLSQDKKREGLR